jgi:GNAT superfamily N-acetyltransferase
MEIRQAYKNDSAAIAKVQVESYRTAYKDIFPPAYLEHFTYQEQEQDWYELLSSDYHEVLYVALVNEKIIAYALSTCNEDEDFSFESELVALPVLEKQQRKGIGRALFAAVARSLQALGNNSLFLWVAAKNRARAFYDKLGGELVAEKPWVNNSYFGTNIFEIAYGWHDIRSLFEHDKE